MKLRTCLDLINADLYRYAPLGWRSLLATAYREPAFRVILLYRICRYLKRRSGLLARVAYLPFGFLFRGAKIRFGISLPIETRVGPGFYIGHYGGIVINGRTHIGANCNLSQGVTIGQTNRGERQGVPTIGDNVYVGPGAKIIGGITVGDHVAIGANAVVTRDVPAQGVAIGIPARVVSSGGSLGYINRTDYPLVNWPESDR